MNKKLQINNYLFTALAISSLAILPGCKLVDWFKDTFGKRESMIKKEAVMNEQGIVGAINDGSKELVTFKGVPVITEKSFTAKKAELMETNPQYKEAVAMMGGEAKCDEYILEGLARTKLLDEWATAKVKNTSAYQKDYQRAVDNITDILNAKYFAQELPVDVTDAEARAFYEKNKDQLPGVRQSTGGIKAMGISLGSEKEAQDFMTKVKEANGDIKKAAKDAGMTDEKVQDFGLVHERSGAINPTLKEKILTITKFPSTQVIKVDDKTAWVVQASGKEAAKYTPFDQVKDHFVEYLKQEKLGKAFEEKINEFKKQYDVKIAGQEMGMKKEEMPMPEAMMPMEKAAESKKEEKKTSPKMNKPAKAAAKKEKAVGPKTA